MQRSDMQMGSAVRVQNSRTGRACRFRFWPMRVGGVAACCLTLWLCTECAGKQPDGEEPALEEPLPQAWQYASAMQAVARRGEQRPGVVLHVGDSITYANPYGQWARRGQGQTEDDRRALAWMHTGADDDTDGWWLSRFDHPDGGRSYTAAGGLRADELLAGGRQGLASLAEMLDRYRPQAVVLMIGTNDASAGRGRDEYLRDVAAALDLMLERGVVPVLSTIPPHHAALDLAAAYNEGLRELARARRLPFIDFEREILRRRPDDWNGTLLNANDVHPTLGREPDGATLAPTNENLRSSGYLLRTWLSVRKLAEVKRLVFDPLQTPQPPRRTDEQQRGTGKPSQRAGKQFQPLGSRETMLVTAPDEYAGQAIRVPVTRDTWFSAVGEEADGNQGGNARLKLKSIQEMSLVDFDPAPLAGRVVLGATLHVKLAGDEILHRVTAASFAAEWVEGTATQYAKQTGSSTFNHARHPDQPWAYAGSDLTAVTLGQGGTVWRMADASPPDEHGWQQVPVHPLIVALRVAGVSHGILLFDDTGSEWSREGERFELRLFPNRYIYSRNSGESSAPYFTVYLGEADRLPPDAPTNLAADATGLPAGQSLVSWDTPQDQGPAGTVGFFARCGGQPVPQYLVPTAGEPGERVHMHLRDLGLPPGAEFELEVQAVDGAGNRSEWARVRGRTSGLRAQGAQLAAAPQSHAPGGAQLPRLGAAQVAVIDELDKLHPLTATLLPERPPEYLAANHLWHAGRREVQLFAARNEFVAFQLAVVGQIKGMTAVLHFDDVQPRSQFYRLWHVSTALGPLPDPAVPWNGAFDVPAADEAIAGQKAAGLLCEVYVPHDAAPGMHRGTLTLQAGPERLELKVSLVVWNFTLPDQLSFLPEMNCYDLPADERAYYRLAHLHRTVLNRVPYYQNGRVAAGCAPEWDGRQLDFSAWDERFGPLFDGSAFADLPRPGIPIECFYLPLHENWPTPMEGHYNGDYWADRAFPRAHRQAFVAASRQFAQHIAERGWHRTYFQCYLNNKNNFKARGWSRGSSPWLLDEPANFQDYWALRYFGEAFHEGVRQAGERGTAPTKLVFRADISRPQWQRDALDHVLNYNVVAGGPFRQYHRLVRDRQRAFGQVVLEYGSPCAIEQSNVQPAAWCVEAWCLAAQGVVPWQTLGNERSWREGDQLALFYPPRPGESEPAASLRLKAFRRGQQDVEYLVLAAGARREPQWLLGEQVLEALRLRGRRQSSADEPDDAGRIHYAELSPVDLWRLRRALGEQVDRLAGQAR